MVRVVVLALGACLVATSCAGVGLDTADAPRVVAAAPTEIVTDGSSGGATDASTTEPVAEDPAAPPPADEAADADATTTEPPTTTEPATTEPATTTPATTTTTPPPPPCSVTAAAGDTLAALAAPHGLDRLGLARVVVENGLSSTSPEPGTVLDLCPGNGFDDVHGVARQDVPVTGTGVELQQAHLNALFASYGIAPLDIDGDPGPITRQLLCAARLALGLPTSTDVMEPGGAEEQQLLANEGLPVPSTSATRSSRWILIDRTCQVMFAGEGAATLRFVFPTSTGHAPFQTRDQDLTPAYRFNPAAGNGGWHNSTTYPVADDNPLNGNMYKPLYFDRGQAIHGATNVPRSPASKGCARLRVGDQDALLAWLGLGGLGSPTTDAARIGVTVNVQGRWNG